MGEGHPNLGSDGLRKDEFQLYDKFTSSHERPLVEFRSRVVV